MAVHLLLLAVAKLRPRLRGRCRIYCDCVGALRKVAFLPRSHLPSGCRHSDVLKIVMLHCSNFSFAMEYVHVRAHQDTRGRTPYRALLRPAQLNCQVDLQAKSRLIQTGAAAAQQSQRTLPLEAVTVRVQGIKVTMDNADHLRFWAQR